MLPRLWRLGINDAHRNGQRNKTDLEFSSYKVAKRWRQVDPAAAMCPGSKPINACMRGNKSQNPARRVLSRASHYPCIVRHRRSGKPSKVRFDVQDVTAARISGPRKRRSRELVTEYIYTRSCLRVPLLFSSCQLLRIVLSSTLEKEPERASL